MSNKSTTTDAKRVSANDKENGNGKAEKAKVNDGWLLSCRESSD